MTKAAQRVLVDALQLPQGDRAAVANRLLNTLEPPPQTHEATDGEWLGEIERRARTALAGEPGVPWEEGKARISDHPQRSTTTFSSV